MRVRRLAASPYLACLTRLYLGDNPFGQAGLDLWQAFETNQQ
jgi:hypothetical protein